MKISMISPSISESNGWGRVTSSMILPLMKKINIQLFIPRKSQTKIYKKIKIISILAPPENRLLKILRTIPSHLYTIIKLILSDYDLIHCLFHYYPYIIDCLIASKIKRKKFIVGVQGTFGVLPLTNKILCFLLKICHKQIDIVHTASEFTKNEVLKYIESPNIIKFPINGVDMEKFVPSSVQNEHFNNFRSGNIILSVGALKIRKGHDILIKAFNLVKKKIKDAKLLIIGEGSLKNYLIQLVNNYNLNDVFFLGSITDRDLVKYYNICDIFVLTPRYYNYNFEGFGLVYLEAGACKKPVIGTKSGGVSEVIKHGITGYLAEENDYIQIAKYITKLLNDKDLRDRLGYNGYLNAKKYTWTKISNRLIRLYEKVLS
ncbi:MAG: glycosyltransferase family 4 protein [Candidatus Helarchaeota archaeon]